jgi:hypothetical protein
VTLPPGFDQRATVYGRDGTTGRYTTVFRSGLACRLAHINRQPGATGAQRAELAGIRTFLWDPAYTLPENAQVEVAGVTGPDGTTPARWNVRSGTLATLRGPSGQACYKQCDVTRVA